MEWVRDYQLFLLDFDGLLVNTEEIHFRAYQIMCENRGFPLPWDFAAYCFNAHYDQATFHKALSQALPELLQQEPEWSVLYGEKKRAMLELLHQGSATMMPGAEELLEELAVRDILRCVVTNSPLEQIALIKQQNPVLATIPHWFTRETYTQPKPHPECYLRAISRLAKEECKVIGFEDSPRGLKALLHTPATSVLVTQVPYPEIPEFVSQGAIHAPSLDQLEVLGIVHPHEK